MTMTIAQKEAHFETFADDVASILREIGARFGGREQIDNDEANEARQRRYTLCYEYPTEQQRGHVWAVLWYGPTGTLQEKQEGKALLFSMPPSAYPVAEIDVGFIEEGGRDEYKIDGQHMVHSTGELRDRLTVMVNTDQWGLRNPHIEENATVHQQFISQRKLFRASTKPLSGLMRKMGTSWQAEEQTEDTPQAKGSTGLFGGSGKKWFFVGYVLPKFHIDDAGRARTTQPIITLDLWQGGTGQIRKSKIRRQIELRGKTQAQIRVVFPIERPVMAVAGIKGAVAQSPAQMQKILTKLWKQNAFGI